MTKHSATTALDAKLRFWSKVRTGPVESCWEWTGALNANGYGKTVVGGEKEYAHRFSYCLHYGVELEELDGTCVLHKCDNPKCVNPSHLVLGSRSDNMTDKVEKNRQHKGEGTPTHKLTADDVIEIRRLRNQGYRLTELAEQYRIAFQSVSDICTRRTWKHIP